MMWIVNILYINLVVGYVCHPVHFVLFGNGFLDIGHVKNVSTDEVLCLAICVRGSALNIANVQLVVLKVIWQLLRLL